MRSFAIVLAAATLLLGWSVSAAAPEEVSRQTRDDLTGYSEQLIRAEEARRLIEKGCRFRDDHELDRARELFEQALLLDTNSLEARFQLGCLEQEAGRYHLAVDHLEWIYRETPARDSLCLLIAENHFALGDCELARTWLDRQNRRQPALPGAAALERKIRNCLKKNSVRYGRKK